MDQVERFGVSMSPTLLQALDKLIESRGYKTRSEAIRDMVRDALVEAEWENQDGEVVGTVTIVYDHHTRELSDALTELQHEHHAAVICATHVHLDHHNCLETVVIRGTSRQVRKIADGLIAARGVKHGKLVCTTTGRNLK
jgi:CopG family nickel-responsive transcriptional regulator